MSKFKIQNKEILAGGNADDVKIIDKQWHSVFSLATVEGKEALYKLAYEGGNSIYLYENPNDFLEGSEIKKLTSRVINSQIGNYRRLKKTFKGTKLSLKKTKRSGTN